MKKKFIFLAMMLFALLGGVNNLGAQETITVGTTSISSLYLPTYIYYGCTYSQQIYVAGVDFELGSASITKVAFMKSGTQTVTRNMRVYMKNIGDKAKFESITDWISVDETNLVYEGAIEYTGGTGTMITIPFNNKFDYAGGNILLCVEDYTGSYLTSYPKHYAFNTNEARALVYYNDNQSTPSGQATQILNNLNYVQFTYEPAGDDLIPAVPTNLQADVVDYQSINLTWNEAENALNYQVYNGEEKIAETDQTEYLVEGLDDNTEFCFTVKSVRYNNNVSDASEQVCATTEVLPVPATPTNLIATSVKHNSVTLTWDAVEYATSYTITYENGMTTTTEPTYVVTGLTPETLYTFSVKAVNVKGESSPAEVSVTTLEYINPFAGKFFRVKVNDGNYAGRYLTVNNYYGSGGTSTVGVAYFQESSMQVFTIEDNGLGQYYLKSGDGYYLVCEIGSSWWGVHANSTTSKTPLEFEYTDNDKFYIKDYNKMTGNSQTGHDGDGYYFKVEKPENSTSVLVYCDAPSYYTNTTTSYITTWSVEEVPFSAAAAAYNSTIFDDETTTLSVTTVAGSGNYTYSWSPANGLSDATSVNPTFTPATTGEHTFTCTVTDTESGSTAEASVTVYVNARPALQLAVSADKELIYNDGETAVLTATATEGYAPYTYSWTLNETEVGTEATYTFSNTTVGEYTLTCTVTDARDNTQTASTTIEVKDESEKPLEIVLGTPINSTTYYPTSPLYGNSYSQQIYTASEINMSACEITSISFMKFNNTALSRNIKVFMLNVNKDSFTSDSDWVSVSDSDVVFDGSFDFAGNKGDWTTIELTNKFSYTGGDILLCVNDHTNDWRQDYPQFYTYSVDAYRSIMIRRDDTPYPDVMSGQAYAYEKNVNHIKFGYEIPAPKPESLVATPAQIHVGETTTLTWNELEGAESYNIYVDGVLNGNTEELIYELSGLTYNLEPGHTIEVAAVYEDETESGKASVTVQVAGTFTIEVIVTDGTNYIENAEVYVDITYAYDEFFNKLEIEVEPAITNEQGFANVTLPLLAKYYDEYDGMWITPYYTVKASKAPYSNAEDNVYCAYISNSQTIGRTLVLTLPTVSYIQVQDEEGEYLYGDVMEGTKVVLSWDEVEGADAYKVYKLSADEVESSETVTKTTYTIEGVWKGDQYAVSALFGELESVKTTANIDVKGNGYFKGYVTDGTNALQGIQVKVSSEYGNVSAVATTNEEGYFIGQIMEGENYILTISHSDYDEFISTPFPIVYQTDYNFLTIELNAKPSASGITEVTATVNGDNVDVEWTVEEAYTKYNVYRRLAGTQGKGDNIAQNVEATSTTDTEWETLDPGTYQYGVSAFVEPQAQTRGDEKLLLEEKFEIFNTDNNIPEGWSKYGEGTSGSATWKCTNQDLTTTITAFDGYMAQSKGSNDINLRYYLVTPPIQTSDNPSTLTFNYVNPNWGTDYSVLEVYWSTINNGDWQLLETYQVSTAWQYPTIDLSAKIAGVQSETIYIAFCHVNHYGYGVGIDNVKIMGEGISLTETQIVWSNDVVKQGPATFEGTVSTDWNLAENWSTGSVPADGAEVTINANAVITGAVNVSNVTINAGTSLTVANGGALTVTGTISQASNYLLVLEEGGQIFQNNANVTARFRMSIDKPSDWSDETNKDGWQFISMPLENVPHTDFTSYGEYDLYKYDGSQDLEWQNHKDGGFEEEAFKSGVGYLASLKDAETATVYGTLNTATPYVFSGYNQIIYNEEKDLANFRLFGNPFTYDIYMSDFDLDFYNDGENDFVSGYAVVNNSGSYDYRTIEPIKVGEGFFVKALSSTAIAYAPASKRSENKSDNSLNITATGNAGKDNVVINLAGKSEGFNKLQNFNDAIATVYVAEDGKNYGIYNCDADVQEVELNFNANQMGNYTISIQPNGKFQTVTLVDRFTGIETNMLVEDYHFTAMSNENNNRFIVKLAVSDQQSAVSDNFVYQSGEDLIIDAEGTVQIIDVMGRVLVSDEVESTNNRINVSGFQNGTYMVRVINGSEVKVEKVVIY